MEETIIYHDVRRQFGMSWYEYGFMDMVANLDYYGKWIEVSQRELAELIGLSAKSIATYKKVLVEKGLLEIDPETNYIRATNKWYHALTVSVH